MLRFLNHINSYRPLIWTMALQELQSRYAGTLLGSFWAVINPILTVVVFWLVFSVGLKVQPVGEMPFILYFGLGLLPWMTFSETLMSSAGAVTGNAHLVKKMVFPTEILPFVQLTANIIVHFVMMLAMLLLLYIYGFSVTIYSIQFFYYLIGLCVFCSGLSWLCSAVNVFHKDIGVVLGVLLNIWFWLTPIAYGIELLPERYAIFLRLNPIFYIVEGYRASFLYQKPFWFNYTEGILFWLLCGFVFLFGAFIFRSLKPEFAEIL